jgi:hypothetical protein
MTPMAEPPRWAEAILRLLLKSSDRESVSGDVLEQYRDSVLPERGRWRADAWYVMQVAGFAWRSVWVWVVLLVAAHVSRLILDWRVPTHDFRMRAMATTYFAIALFASTGLWGAWRSRSVRAGILAGVMTSATGAVISILSALVLLAVWHDQETLAAIQGSGGLGEVFTLPLIIVVPATFIATLGALLGKGLARSLRSRLAD